MGTEGEDVGEAGWETKECWRAGRWRWSLVGGGTWDEGVGCGGRSLASTSRIHIPLWPHWT